MNGFSYRSFEHTGLYRIKQTALDLLRRVIEALIFVYKIIYSS